MKQTVVTILLILFLNASNGGAAASGAEAYFGQIDASIITQTGCNSTDNVQIPGTTSVFVGRQLFKQDLSLTTVDEGCGKDQALLEAVRSNRWGVVLSQLDWQNKRFTIIKPLVIPTAVITGGPMTGAIVKTASDPDMIKYHGQYLMAFECTISNGRNYGVVGTSACIVPYDPATQEVRLDRAYVVVSGKSTNGGQGAQFHSASVPQLLVFRDKLFLYWSEVTVERGTFTRVGVRGAELEVDEAGFYWVKGMGRVAYTIDPPTIEVWGPVANDPMSDTAVDIKSLWVHGTDVIALVGLGGGGCAASGPQRGCFRMAMAKTSEPIGDHIFNKSRLLDKEQFPTTHQGYTRPIRNPAGTYSLIGNFYRPFNNGYSETRPVPADWSKLSVDYVVVIFPFPDKNLWPTE